jgi:hypothetical protein
MGGQLEDVAVGARPWYGSHWYERLYHRKFPLSSFNSTRLALLEYSFRLYSDLI